MFRINPKIDVWDSRVLLKDMRRIQVKQIDGVTWQIVSVNQVENEVEKCKCINSKQE